MFYEERYLTKSRESLRFAYTEQEIREAISKNLEAIKTFIQSESEKAIDFANKSGVSDVSVEKLIKLSTNRSSMGRMRWEAEMALYHANRIVMARSRVKWLETVRDHGAYIIKDDIGRALLTGQEQILLIEKFDESQYNMVAPAPIRDPGLSTMGRVVQAAPFSPSRYVEEEPESNLADALKL